MLEISYDGTAYNGWQRQLNAVTVQETLETKLSVIAGQTCAVTGCGRTDTGVHADKYILHFDMDDALPEHLVYRLNSILPEDIAVHHLYLVPNTFHARFDALNRTYRYRVHRQKNPFVRRYSYYYPYVKGIERMNEGAEIIKQYTEFGSFCKSRSQNKTKICRIMECHWEDKGEELVFHIQADRFLRNMVRAIVGTLLEVHAGRISLDELRAIIRAGDRKLAGRSVPGHGLMLVKTEYDQSNWKLINDN